MNERIWLENRLRKPNDIRIIITSKKRVLSCSDANMHGERGSQKRRRTTNHFWAAVESRSYHFAWRPLWSTAAAKKKSSCFRGRNYFFCRWRAIHPPKYWYSLVSVELVAAAAWLASTKKLFWTDWRPAVLDGERNYDRPTATSANAKLWTKNDPGKSFAPSGRERSTRSADDHLEMRLQRRRLEWRRRWRSSWKSRQEWQKRTTEKTRGKCGHTEVGRYVWTAWQNEMNSLKNKKKQ